MVYYKKYVAARYFKNSGIGVFIVLKLMGARKLIGDKMLPGQLAGNQAKA